MIKPQVIQELQTKFCFQIMFQPITALHMSQFAGSASLSGHFDNSIVHQNSETGAMLSSPTSAQWDPSSPKALHQRRKWPYQCVGEPDEVLKPQGAVCEKISGLLGRASERPPNAFGENAHQLPNLPGLSVQDVGTVSLPVGDEMALRLTKQATEERDNVWAIPPDLVTIKNEAWISGIRTLSQLSAVKLGLEGVELQPELTKMDLYGHGGERPKQQDVDESSHCAATLVVQLPSEYTGGKLVVYEAEGGGELRYEMGTVDGSATFVPHYVVYDADSLCAVEEFTGGGVSGGPGILAEVPY
jgi:hypothetical protein